MAQNYSSETHGGGRNTVKRSRAFQPKGREWSQDWKCDSCYFSNRHFRDMCYRCKKSKSSVGYFNSEGQTYDSKVKQEGRAGIDWTCINPNCEFPTNRHFRTICFKCRTPKQKIISSCSSSKVIKGENNTGQSNDHALDNPMVKFSLATSFGHAPITSDTSGNVPSHQSKPDLVNRNHNDSMAKYGLPSGFGYSNKHPSDSNIHQDDNWTCLNCRDSNHGVNGSCSKCNYPKSRILPKGSEASNGIDNGNQGDWTCHCCSKSAKGYQNRYFRKTCYRCDAPKLFDTSQQHDILPVKREWMETYEADVNYFQDKYAEGDWYCAACGNFANGHHRSTCYKCKQPRPRAESYQVGDNIDCNNDWKCSQCNITNTHWKTWCHKCGQNRDRWENGDTGIKVETEVGS